MAGRDEADPGSMRSSIYRAIDIFRNRKAYDALQAGKMPKREGDEPRQERRGGRPQIA